MMIKIFTMKRAVDLYFQALATSLALKHIVHMDNSLSNSVLIWKLFGKTCHKNSNL